MPKLFNVFTLALAACVFGGGLSSFRVQDDRERAQHEGARAQDEREQTRAGVTVRLEKMTLQRVFREPEDETQKTHRRSLSFFVSITGQADPAGPVEVEFANDYQPSKLELIGKSSPHWKTHLGLDVDPAAFGMELRLYIPNDQRIGELLPARVTVSAPSQSGEALKFVFSGVEF